MSVCVCVVGWSIHNVNDFGMGQDSVKYKFVSLIYSIKMVLKSIIVYSILYQIYYEVNWTLIMNA